MQDVKWAKVLKYCTEWRGYKTKKQNCFFSSWKHKSPKSARFWLGLSDFVTEAGLVSEHHHSGLFVSVICHFHHTEVTNFHRTRLGLVFSYTFTVNVGLVTVGFKQTPFSSGLFQDHHSGHSVPHHFCSQQFQVYGLSFYEFVLPWIFLVLALFWCNQQWRPS